MCSGARVEMMEMEGFDAERGAKSTELDGPRVELELKPRGRPMCSGARVEMTEMEGFDART